MIVAKTQYNSQKETSGEEKSSQEVGMRFVSVNIQIEAVESEFEGGIRQSLRVLAQEEMSENDEGHTE